MTDKSTADSPPETRLNDGEGLEIAHEEDFGIARNDDGELLPVKQRIPGTDKAIECIPVASGPRQEYGDVFDGADPDADRVAELFDEHIVEGIGADATAEDIEGKDGIPYGLVSGLVQALKNSSGEDVFLAVEEQRNEELAQQMDLLDRVGEERVETLAELGKNASENGQE